MDVFRLLQDAHFTALQLEEVEISNHFQMIGPQAPTLSNLNQLRLHPMEISMLLKVIPKESIVYEWSLPMAR